MTYTNGSGAVYTFPFVSGTYQTPAGLPLKLTASGSGYTLTNFLTGEVRVFDSSGRSASAHARAIAVIFRRSPVVLYSLAGSHISRPAYLIGTTINASPDTAPTLHALMARAGIRPSQCSEVALGPRFTQLYSGAVPVFAGYSTTGAMLAQRTGHKLHFIFPADYDVHFYGSTIVATDTRITTQPDLVQRFLRATLKGWRYAVENPTTVGALVARYSPHVDQGLQTAEMTASLPLINTGEDAIGWIQPAIWAGMATSLRAQGVLTKPVDVRQLYTVRFLQALTRSQQ